MQVYFVLYEGVLYMTEGTKLEEFHSLDEKEHTSFSSQDLSPTRLGDISDFEKSLYSEDELKKPLIQKQTIQSSKDITDLDFEAVMNAGLIDIQQGEKITGVVRHVTKSGVFVDFNYKSDGFIPNSEFSLDPDVNPMDAVSAGEDIEAYVEKLETKEGYTLLTRKRMELESFWNELVKCQKIKDVITVHIDAKVQGGLVASYKKMIKGFIPASYVLKEGEEELSPFVGKNLEVSVIQADRRRKKIIFSCKHVKSKALREEKQKLLEELEVGQVKKGTVKSIKEFGVFVELGAGLEGLVHISELSWSHVYSPADVVSLGQEVNVFVLGVDKESEKISLGMKQLSEDPWVNVSQKYKLNQSVEGTVSRLATFGIFVKLEEGLDGLIHISEVSDKRIDQLSSHFKVGDKVQAIIIKLIPEKQRIGLSIKQLLQEQKKQEDPSKGEETEKLQNQDLTVSVDSQGNAG